MAQDHPRVCGKNTYSKINSLTSLGSPPRVREKQHNQTTPELLDGITPACAGKTSTLNSALIVRWDHPRVCGKNSAYLLEATSNLGSPPRVREKPFLPFFESIFHRITPACAGKTALTKMWKALD